MEWAPLHDLIGRHGETISWWQMSLRGVVVFAVGLVFVRLAGARVFGKWGALDFLLAVIIGSNLSRAITGNAPFGATLCVTAVLIGLHTALSYAAVWRPGLGDWLKGRSVRLVENGVIDQHALRRHAVGRGDLDQALHEAGCESADQVRAAYLERSGKISVVPAVSAPTSQGDGDR